MNVGENQGCGRKIRTGEQVTELLTSVMSSKILALDEHEVQSYEGKGPLVGVSDKLSARIQKAQELQWEAKDFALEYPCCTIIHGDCRDHLWRFPARSFDLVVTDPPYGMDLTVWQEHHGKLDWDGEYPVGVVQAIIDDKVSDLARLGSYFFCRWDNLWDHEKRTGVFALRKPKSVLVWHKVGTGGAGDTEHEHTRDYEMALFYPGPEHKFKKRPPSVLTCRPPGNHAHPTQKPVEMIKKILSWYDCETVLDPYMGSGTTAVAAKERGKHFLGFEANEKYYQRAIQRVAEAKLDSDLQELLLSSEAGV
jgi:16S rRNA G966 N2-methylase RsmD